MKRKKEAKVKDSSKFILKRIFMGEEETSLKSNEIGKIKSNILILNHELKKRMDNIKRLNNEIKEAHKIAIEKDKHLGDLQGKYEKSEHNISVLKQELGGKGAEMKSIEHELDMRSRELQLEKKHNIDETKNLRKRISVLEKELDETKQIVIHHHEGLGRHKKNIEDKDFELIRLGQKINNCDEENSKLKDLISNKDAQIDVLKHTIVKKNSIIQQLNKEIDSIKENIERK